MAYEEMLLIFDPNHEHKVFRIVRSFRLSPECEDLRWTIRIDLIVEHFMVEGCSAAAYCKMKQIVPMLSCCRACAYRIEYSEACVAVVRNQDVRKDIACTVKDEEVRF